MFKKIKVLLVEDDVMIVKMYKRKFNKDDFELTTAFNGEEAMKKIKNDRPDIVLLDIMMPKMNGLEVLNKIKADPFLSGIPVVMLTNLGDRDEDVEKCRELGAFDYWIKANISLNDLSERIKKIIKK
jgi:two-component system alkaline phosphatase synthesis response regulator PhoP